MNAAPSFVQHCTSPAVLFRAAPGRRDLAPGAVCNANVASNAQSTAAARPELRSVRRADRPPQVVPRKAASGVRLYEVAVPLAEDPGKVHNVDIPCVVTLPGSRHAADPMASQDDFSVHEALCKASASRLGCKARTFPAGYIELLTMQHWTTPKHIKHGALHCRLLSLTRQASLSSASPSMPARRKCSSECSILRLRSRVCNELASHVATRRAFGRYVVDIQEAALSQARCRRPKFRPGQVERCACRRGKQHHPLE